MTEGIVEGLEIVQVDEQQGVLVPASRAAGQGLLHTVEQQPTIGQPGQCIVEGQALDLVFGRLARRDVGEDGDVMGGFASAIFDGTDA